MPVTTVPCSYRFDLRNSVSDVARMNEWLTGILKELATPEPLAYSVLLAVEEAVTNVVSYAFAPGTDHVIDVSLDVEATRFVAVISDDGVAFDPLAHPPPKPPTDLASATIGGLGITLIRQYATTVHYSRQNETNRLELTFAR